MKPLNSYILTPHNYIISYIHNLIVLKYQISSVILFNDYNIK